MDDNEDTSIEDLKWGLRRRLEFIDFRLFWEGKINRSDLRDQFRISPQQATNDIDKFLQFAGDSMAYDATAKAFVRSAAYQPTFARGQAQRYLMQIQALRLGWLDKVHTWFATTPELEVVELGRRPLDDHLVMVLNSAIKEHRSITATYWTMSGKPAAERELMPHSLAYAAGRWHMRAFEPGNGDFRDYNLSRLENVELGGNASIDAGLDYEWKTIGKLRLVPNPALSPAVQDSVRREYAFDDAELIKPCRLALLFYLDRQYHLTDDKIDVGKRHLVLTNFAELEELRKSARRMSVAAIEGGFTAS